MQNKTTTLFKRILSAIVCIVLITAMALIMVSCGQKSTTIGASSSVGSSADEKSAATELGEGSTKFDFSVTDADGNQTDFIIKTDKKTVGDALVELELIEGEESAYGLYVKTVNGTTLDFDKDGKYWAFYVNGEYVMSGVDTTEIKNGESYAFKAE